MKQVLKETVFKSFVVIVVVVVVVDDDDDVMLFLFVIPVVLTQSLGFSILCLFVSEIIQDSHRMLYFMKEILLFGIDLD